MATRFLYIIRWVTPTGLDRSIRKEERYLPQQILSLEDEKTIEAGLTAREKMQVQIASYTLLPKTRTKQPRKTGYSRPKKLLNQR